MNILESLKKLTLLVTLMMSMMLVSSCSREIIPNQNANAFCDSLSQSIDDLSEKLETSPHDPSVVSGANLIEKFDAICNN